MRRCCRGWWPAGPTVRDPRCVPIRLHCLGRTWSTITHKVGGSCAGANELAVAVAELLRGATAQTVSGAWGTLRLFVSTLLLRGPSHDLRSSEEDAYLRVELHEACIEALAAVPDCLRELALVTCCGSGQITGWQWATTALRQVKRASRSKPLQGRLDHTATQAADKGKVCLCTSADGEALRPMPHATPLLQALCRMRPLQRPRVGAARTLRFANPPPTGCVPSSANHSSCASALRIVRARLGLNS